MDDFLTFVFVSSVLIGPFVLVKVVFWVLMRMDGAGVPHDVRMERIRKHGMHCNGPMESYALGDLGDRVKYGRAMGWHKEVAETLEKYGKDPKWKPR